MYDNGVCMIYHSRSSYIKIFSSSISHVSQILKEFVPSHYFIPVKESS